jgi:AcrR family transcriptional regulator
MQASMSSMFVTASTHERLREAAKTLFAEHGYEATSTAEICRIAATSQSQLIKHFVNKQGLLEAIFEHAWEQIRPVIHLGVEAASSPSEKLIIVGETMLTILTNDKELRALFLREGHRIHADGQMASMVPGFLEFVTTLDGILNELVAAGELRPDMHPQALRSGLMGAFEGILRDQFLARPSHFPADYSESEARAAFRAFISSCLVQ